MSTFNEIIITIEISKLKQYLNFSERVIDEKINEFNNKFDERTIEMSEQDKADYFDRFSSEAYVVELLNPYFTRVSLFLNIYAYFEYELYNSCTQLQRNLNLKISPKDLRSNGIERSKDYISKVCNTDFPCSDSEWKIFKEYNELRNIFSHSYGQIAHISKDKKKTITNIKGLSIEQLELSLDREFVVTFLDKVEAVLKSIAKKINK